MFEFLPTIAPGTFTSRKKSHSNSVSKLYHEVICRTALRVFEYSFKLWRLKFQKCIHQKQQIIKIFFKRIQHILGLGLHLAISFRPYII